jgi:hypothetical protein
MKIENLPLCDLKHYEFNNRTHPIVQIERIAASIKEFGFNQPIIVDEDNVILVGHGRALAAMNLHLKEVPIVRLKDLTEVQKKAYRILDNKLQNDSTWNFNNLELELGFLSDADLEFEPWGLDKLANMFSDLVTLDTEAEWQDMPEYQSKDNEAHRVITVRFSCDNDVKDFIERIEQEITEKTKSIWHPKAIPNNLKNTRVVDNES